MSKGISVIVHLYLDPSLRKQLQTRKDGVIRDIYDGQCYRKESLTMSCHFCATLAIFRSPKSELRPVWLVVNELPQGI